MLWGDNVSLRQHRRYQKKKTYILDQIKYAKFGMSTDKLKSNVTSPCTLSFSDASPNLVVPFCGNNICKSTVESYIGRNRDDNPTLTIDSNANSIADGWTASTDAGITGLSEIDGGQKLSITASSNAGVHFISRTYSGFVAGETVNIGYSLKNLTLTGGYTTRVIIQALTSSSVFVSTLISATYTNTTYNEISNTYIMPPTATKIVIYFRATSNNAGDTGSSWYKDISIKKVPVLIASNTMLVDSNADGVPDNWTFTKSATGTCSITTLGAHLLMSASSAQFQSVKLALDGTFNCVQNEVINVDFFYKFIQSTGSVACKTIVEFLDVDGNSLDGSYIGLSVNTDLTRNISTITVPANASISKAKYYIYLQANTVGGGDTGTLDVKNFNIYRSNVSAYIAQATDQSGNNNHAIQVTQASQPRVMSNGIWEADDKGKVLPFYDKINDALNFTSTVNIQNTDFTIMSKVNPYGVVSGWSAILGGDSGSVIFGFESGTLKMAKSYGSSSPSPWLTYATNSTMCISTIFNNTTKSLTMIKDKTTQLTTFSTSFTSNQKCMGMCTAGIGHFYGSIGTVIIYDRELTVDQVNKLK